MELDNLKAIWKESVSLPAATTQLELEEMLSKKSQSPIAKLKRNLLRELIGVVILYGVTIFYYLFENKPGMIYLAVMLIVLGALYGWFYVAKRRLLNSMECVSCEVKSNLSLQLKTLEKYVKLYLWVGTLLIPVILISSFLIGLYFGDNGEFLAKMGNKIFAVFAAWVLISLVLTIPVYFLNKWYVHKLYGQHVKKLKSILNEMNEIPFK
jgi:membrane protease YdiL (CAAX protease family)